MFFSALKPFLGDQKSDFLSPANSTLISNAAMKDDTAAEGFLFRKEL